MNYKIVGYSLSFAFVLLGAFLAYLGTRMVPHLGEIVMTPTRIGYGGDGTGLFFMSTFTIILAFIVAVLVTVNWDEVR